MSTRSQAAAIQLWSLYGMTKITKINPFDVVGLTAKTNHLNAMKDIALMWHRAASFGLLHQADAYAVYHDYQLIPGGYEVSVTIGRKADSSQACHDDCRLISIPEQHCIQIETNGTIAQIQDAWGTVWRAHHDKRNFQYDVEHWVMNAQGEPIRADIFVGVKQ
jgi:predicted transcriptional regulator YdeE